MGELNWDQLTDRTARGKLDRHYFLKVEEPFLRDQAIHLLVRAHLGDSSSDFDLDQIAGDETSAEAVAASLETPPLLSPRRVIVIRAAQGLIPSARSVLERAVAAPVDGRTVIVSAEVPKRSSAKFYRILETHCRVVSLRPPRASDLPGWLIARAESVHGMELERTAAQRLVAGLGERLGVLASELEKLVTYVQPRGTIALDDVLAAVGGLPRVDRWEWVDRVMERKLGAAISELPDLLDSGESAVGLIIWLSESLLRLGLARQGGDVLRKAMKRDGAGRLSWKVRIYESQARRWSEAEIDDALEELLRADQLIKSGGLPERRALEEALLRMRMRAEAGQARADAGRL